MMDLKRIGLGIAGVLMMGLLALPVMAAGTYGSRDTSSSMTQDKSMSSTTTKTGAFETIQSSKLLNMDVIGANGDKLGSIENIAVHRTDGRIAYGVLSHGGFLGIGGKSVAIPWKAFELRTDADGKQVLALNNVSKEALEAAPSFDKDNWPLQPTLQVSGLSSSEMKSSQDVAVRDEISRDMDTPSDLAREDRSLIEDDMGYGYVGEEKKAADRDIYRDTTRSADEARADMPDAYVAGGRLVKLDSLIGWDIRHQNQDIGEIKDLAIDVKNGHLAYAIVSFDNTIDQLNDRHAVVPWSALSLSGSEEKVAFKGDVDINTLVAVSYTGDQVPSLSDQSYAQRLHSQFNVEPYWETFGYIGDDARDAGREMKKEMKEGAHEMKEGAREMKQDVQDTTRDTTR